MAAVPSGKPLRSTWYVPHEHWLKRVRLYPSGMTIETWGWHGRRRHFIPLEEIEEVAFARPHKSEESVLLLRLTSGKKVWLSMRGLVLWKLELDRLLGREGESLRHPEAEAVQKQMR